MNLYEKISLLGPAAQYDTCGPRDLGKTTDVPGVYHAQVGGGNICRLFKVLQSNVCQNNCRYCAWRRDRNCQRTQVTPDEMARAFELVYSRRLVDGLFLSSGIVGSPEQTMGQLLDTAEILRTKQGYTGYLHLKIMPGVTRSSIRQALTVANRVSLNIESPTETDLLSLSPDKNLKQGFYYTLSLISQEIKKRRYAGQKAPSLTTQFVVGAAEEKDYDIIKATHLLYKNFNLKRVFYSAFRPVINTPLAERPAASLTRQHRLYQADFLLRFYRFSPWDIPVDKGGFLSEMTDPKMVWAKNHPAYFPVNLNRAGYWQLLKVPGIGPGSARKLLRLRQKNKIYSLKQLAGQRLQLKKLSPFVYY